MRPDSYTNMHVTFMLSYFPNLSTKNLLRLVIIIIIIRTAHNGPLYSNAVIGTLAVDGWAVTFGTARRAPGRAAALPSPSSLYQM